VTGDEAYGQDPALRGWLETRGIGYVLAVARHHRMGAGRSRRVDELTGPAGLGLAAGFLRARIER
jgi:hypothetical protein